MCLYRYACVALLMLLAGTAKADAGAAWSPDDANRDGFLDRDEFSQFKTRHARTPSLEAIWRFDRIDTDGDGRISQQEMASGLQEQFRKK